MNDQNPASGFPDPNSAVPPLNQRVRAKRKLAPAVTAPGKPAGASLTTDLLYKGAQASLYRAARRYPALFKLAQARIGEVKCQPSCLRVSAVGEGDTSGLKIRPWQINGQEAFDSMQQDVEKQKS